MADWNLRSLLRLMKLYSKWGSAKEALFVVDQVLRYYGGDSEEHVVSLRISTM